MADACLIAKLRLKLSGNKQEILPLEATLELGVGQSTQDRSVFLSCHFPGLEAAQKRE